MPELIISGKYVAHAQSSFFYLDSNKICMSHGLLTFIVFLESRKMLDICTIHIYANKSCVKQCLDALVFVLVLRLAFIIFACSQIEKQMHYSCAFACKNDMYMAHKFLTKISGKQTRLVHASVKLKYS